MKPSKRIIIAIVNFHYKWLPIIMGCHCKEDRSFHIKGYRFPVCARCTGELLGIVLSLFTLGIYQPDASLLFVLTLPLLFDGSMQLLTEYQSTNFRRLLTGIPFGWSISSLYLQSAKAVFFWGFNIGKYILVQ